MDQALYDIYFSGQLVAGTSPTDAQQNLAKLFKSSPEKMAQLFNGASHCLKRSINTDQALRYKSALHKAGLLVAMKKASSQASAATVQRAQASTPTPSPTAMPTTSSINPEKIVTTQPLAPMASPESAAEPVGEQKSSWDLAPAGSDLLTANERSDVPERSVDTSAIKLVSAFSEIETASKPSPAPPNVEHISAAPAGEDLLVDKPSPPPPLPLDLSAISLAAEGENLVQLDDGLEPLDPDTSAISIAQLGADLLEGTNTAPPPAAPDTSHLSLNNDS